MSLPKKSKVPRPTEIKKIRSENSVGNPSVFFYLIALPPALILTIVFWLSDIKTPFWSERGTYRYPWVRGYIAVFIFLWIFIVGASIILYVFLFLLKSIRGKSNRRKRVGRYLFIFFGDQLLISILSVILLQKKEIGWKLLPILFLIPLNGFFLHYFFSRPVMKFLHRRYPYYFPQIFAKQEGSKVPVDGLDLTIKKTRTTGWPIMFTLSLVNCQIFSLLAIVKKH